MDPSVPNSKSLEVEHHKNESNLHKRRPSKEEDEQFHEEEEAFQRQVSCVYATERRCVMPRGGGGVNKPIKGGRKSPPKGKKSTLRSTSARRGPGKKTGKK